MYTRTTVVGIFDDRSRAQAAVRDLHALGIADDDLGVVTRENNTLLTDNETRASDGKDSKAAEGAAVGAATGAGIGALWAVGIAAGVLPVIGPVIAGGFLTALVASAAGGAAAAGLVGALVGLGIPEEDARNYEKQVHSGRTLISVRDTERVADVTDIFHEHGGRDVHTQGMSVSHPR